MQKTNRCQFQSQSRSRNRNFDFYESTIGQSLLRDVRWLAALSKEILSVANDAGSVHLRQVAKKPLALYRLELENPVLHYRRTAFLNAHALRALLEDESIRATVRIRKPTRLRSQLSSAT